MSGATARYRYHGYRSPLLRGARQATLRRTRRSDTVTAGVSDRRQLLLEVSIERRPGNPQGLADFPDGVALIFSKAPQLLDLLGSQHLGPTKQPTSSSSSCQACVGPLPDEIPLKLCERSEDMEDELAATGRGVDLLLQGAEANAPADKS